MRPSVLIVEDSPSTAHLARLALTDVPCEVEVAPNALQAIELVRGVVIPWVLVIDAHLPGVQPAPFVVALRDAAPEAAMVLLLERGVTSPNLPTVTVQLFKPLQPRRFAAVVNDLLADREDPHDDDADSAPVSDG